MRQTSLDSAITVTCTREIRPGLVQTAVINAHHLPTGVSLPSTAVARFLAVEHWHIARSRYRRPSHAR